MTPKLSRYQEKRDFSKTPEPSGQKAPVKGSKTLHYVLQKHDASHLHYDFRLEWEGVLLSWAVPKGPPSAPKDKRLAVRVEDHPLEYRNFEGTIPPGEYGAGTVLLWDEGTWEPKSEDVSQALEQGSLKFTLHGQRLQGGYALVQMKGKASGAGKNWLLLKEKDPQADAAPPLDEGEEETSIRSQRTLAEIAQAPLVRLPFTSARPQLAELSERPPQGKNWLHELKYDGYRLFAAKDGQRVIFTTRSGADWTDKFQALAEHFKRWDAPSPCVLDGEVVAMDEQGHTRFSALQRHLLEPEKASLTYVAFDLLALGDQDLRGRPLLERKRQLEKLLQGAPRALQYSRHQEGSGQKVLEQACQAQMEGIVSKETSSLYSGSRDGTWRKIKCEHRQEFVIGGYTRTEKKTTGFSALLLGYYEDGQLVYAGRTGTGFSQSLTQAIYAQLKPLETPSPPFQDPPKSRPQERTVWVKPALVAEARFAEWTRDKKLRQASFKGLREDKDPKSVRRELPAPREELEPVTSLSITHPDKVLYEEEGITKEEIARYYQRVASRLLPYLRRRPLTLVRCPQNAQDKAQCFYQKHSAGTADALPSLSLKENDDALAEYLYVEKAEHLAELSQLGTIELHPWASRIDTLEQPDMMVFDLDPAQGVELADIQQGALDLKAILDDLELRAFLKTSGGKGYHIVLPLDPGVPWERLHEFAHLTAQAMEQRWPTRYTADMRKSHRKGKILIDWQRNTRGATSVSPYSLRARAHAPLSWPIAWEDLVAIAPDQIQLRTLDKWIGQSDPWADFFAVRQSLRSLSHKKE